MSLGKKKAPQSLKSEQAQDRFMQDQPRVIYLNFPHGKSAVVPSLAMV